MKPIPIFEAKNKLPFYIHQTEESGPVFISRHDKIVSVLLSYDEYNRIIAKKEKDTILDRANEFRRKTKGLITNEDIDRIFDVRDHNVDSYESHVFDGVLDN